MSEINGVPANTALVLPTDSLDAKVQKLREEYDTTGLKRNNLEVALNQACEKYGADSAEAKTAKARLDEAQAQLEKIQAALREAVKASSKKTTLPSSCPPKKGHYSCYKLIQVERILVPSMSLERLQPLFREYSPAMLFKK